MNWLSLLIDLVLLGLVVLCAWRGWKQGIIIGAVSIAAIFLCLCLGKIVAETYDEEFVAVPASIGDGLVDSFMTKIQLAEYGLVKEGVDDNLVVRLTAEQKKDVYYVSFAVCRQLGLHETLSSEIAHSTAALTNTVNQSMSSVLSDQIWLRVTRFLIFLIIYLLAIIILAAVRNTIDVFLSLPGLEIVNRIIGAVLGAFQGVMIVLLITMALRYTGAFFKEDITNTTLLASKLMEKNLLASILGI